MKIQSLSNKLNASGLAISEGWMRRCAACGVSFRKVCQAAEETLAEAGGFDLKGGSLSASINIWRFQPPAAALLLHELYGQIQIATPPPARIADAYAKLVERIDGVHFSKSLPAVRYYMAIEEAVLRAEKEARP
jgi:hypothetical protein